MATFPGTQFMGPGVGIAASGPAYAAGMNAGAGGGFGGDALTWILLSQMLGQQLAGAGGGGMGGGGQQGAVGVAPIPAPVRPQFPEALTSGSLLGAATNPDRVASAKLGAFKDESGVPSMDTYVKFTDDLLKFAQLSAIYQTIGNTLSSVLNTVANRKAVANAQPDESWFDKAFGLGGSAAGAGIGALAAGLTPGGMGAGVGALTGMGIGGGLGQGIGGLFR